MGISHGRVEYRTGNAKIIEKPELQITAFEDGYLVRGVKANFRFKKNNTQFVEDLVFFLKDNQVQAVNFGLEHSAIFFVFPVLE